MAPQSIVRNDWVKEFIVELIGTMILCAFGNASIAVWVLDPNKGSPLAIHFSWGIGATFGIYVSRGTSGGHINPAVTISKYITTSFPLGKVFRYIAAQTAGAFLSSCLVYFTYMDMEKNDHTATIFATYPRDNVTVIQALGTSIIGTFLMITSICAINDPTNHFKPDSGLAPIFTGMAVFVYGITFSLNTGYAINPARDFGPRLFIYMAGFSNVFTRGNNIILYYWWIPLLGPIVGAVLATIFYGVIFSENLTIFGCHLKKTKNDNLNKEDVTKMIT